MMALVHTGIKTLAPDMAQGSLSVLLWNTILLRGVSFHHQEVRSEGSLVHQSLYLVDQVLQIVEVGYYQ